MKNALLGVIAVALLAMVGLLGFGVYKISTFEQKFDRLEQSINSVYQAKDKVQDKFKETKDKLPWRE